ncbi:MAG: GSCFA domain-containing protein [Prevotella sp.]|nr:GSCFA domain-containing protein [Prevotella sp.]MDD7029498.1 GSCFA domain-containing protein [Prevotellaceae bacterium]MDY5210619.1 GSCFA domain-containing protein [Prevotella sp.]
MEFRTVVDITAPDFFIEPEHRILTVGSCFADHLGRKFRDEAFVADVNPYGVMYNPASILHTVERYGEAVDVAIFTLGTNHVYREKATGEIVDNCQKRPQALFQEEILSVDVCRDYLLKAIQVLRNRNSHTKIIITVSPIRYAKYGYHGSQLSKAALLLAVDSLMRDGDIGKAGGVYYFPAYEIVNDELRDYRFYAPDMLHPSQQAVDYIWERFVAIVFSDSAREYLREWKPVKEALAHRPFNPDSDAYRSFLARTMEQKKCLSDKYPHLKSINQ